MATIKSSYLGSLRIKSIHIQSGKEITTDAPTDNNGKGEFFSPTDLVSAALGNCMLTIIGIAAEKHNFNIDGTTIDITKIMAENPRRIAEVILDFHFPDNNYNEKEKKIIEYAVKTCPVAKSLHPDLKQTVKYNF
jgi:putative redox protein